MLKLVPDSGTLGSEPGIYSKTVQKVKPVDCARGEIHMLSFSLREETQNVILVPQNSGGLAVS